MKKRRTRFFVFLSVAFWVHGSLLLLGEYFSENDALDYGVKKKYVGKVIHIKRVTKLQPQQDSTVFIEQKNADHVQKVTKEQIAVTMPVATRSSINKKDEIVLFHEDVLQSIAVMPFTEEKKGLEKIRIKQWNHERYVFQQAQMAGRIPELRKLGASFLKDFLPETKELAQAAEFGISSFSKVTPYMDLAKKMAGRTFGSSIEHIHDTRFTSLPNLFCVGACYGEFQTHLVSQLQVVIVVDHNIDGQPVSWSVHLSSGFQGFDYYGITAVRKASERLHQISWSQTPRMSKWLFLAQVYRYGRAELLLSPFFKPSGKKLHDESNILGVSELEKSVSLVAVDFYQ